MYSHAAGWPPRGGWRAIRVLALALVAGSCGHCDVDEKVSRVRVEPPVVQVPAGYQVELRARAFDKHGYTLLRDDIEWDWAPQGPEVWVVTNLGTRAILELAQMASGSHEIVVKADGKSAVATVVALDAAPNAELASVDPTLVPSIAYVWGTGESLADCDPNGIAVAFERYGLLGTNLIAGNCRAAAAVLSARKTLLYLSTPTLWTELADQVGEAERMLSGNGHVNGVPSNGTPPDLEKPLELPVKVWIAVAAQDVADAEQDAQLDIGTANRVLERNRVGVHLSPDFEVVSDPDAVGKSCGDTDAPMPVNPGSLNVYYLSWSAGMPQGEACNFRTVASDPEPTCETTTPDPDEFAYFYVHWRRRTGTTLVHELGHVLGLSRPYLQVGSHTGKGTEPLVDGFTSDNVMWTSLDGDKALSRESFSIGQVFRMVIDEHSWLNRSVRMNQPTENCCKNSHMCPNLAFDLTDLGWPP